MSDLALFSPKKNIFRSGSDALLLAAYAVKHLQTCTAFVELGTGDGLLAQLLIEAWPMARGLGLDCQQEALEQARKRYEEVHNTSTEKQRLIFAYSCLEQRKKLRTLCQEHNFLSVPCVLSNPPYYPSQKGRRGPHAEREKAVRSEKDTLHIFCKAASTLLVHHGHFFCIYAAKHTPMLLHTLEAHNFGIRTLLAVHSRPQKPAKWVLVGARKNAISDVCIETSLCLYAQEQGTAYSTEAMAFCPWL